LPAAYNAPAAIDVKGWDFYLFGSFIYWRVSQDDMDLAHVTPSFTDTGLSIPGALAFQQFEYKPGFKLGLGFNTSYDDWVVFAEYTRLHQRVSTTQIPPVLPTGAPGTWTGADWFAGLATGSFVTSRWRMNLDMLDLLISRPFYEGSKLTIDPFIGLRGFLLRQNLNVELNTPFVHLKTKSWAIGPNVGMMSYWLLGCSGFRFEGKAAGSLLFQKFRKFTHKELLISSTEGFTFPNVLNISRIGPLSTVRPVAELGLGLGWGSYISCNNYYIDFSARYDFLIFWAQNAIRNFNSRYFGYADDFGDLLMHGLTASARFDF